MCLFSAPKAPKIEQPARKDVVTRDDSAAIAAAGEKRKRGYQSTVATSGGGLFDAAPIKKVTLGS